MDSNSLRQHDLRSSVIVTTLRFVRVASDYSLFVKKTLRGCIILLICVDDIILSGSYTRGNKERRPIKTPNQRLRAATSLQYIEVLRDNNGVLLCQKYLMDKSEENRMLEAKPPDTPLKTSIKLELDNGEPLLDQSK